MVLLINNTNRITKMKKRIAYIAVNSTGRERSDDPVVETRAKTMRGVEAALRAAGHLHNDEKVKDAEFMLIDFRLMPSAVPIIR